MSASKLETDAVSADMERESLLGVFEMDPHQRFFQSLTQEDEQLIVIREFLYDGDWKEVTNDLIARRDGKPYVFKLSSRIDEDLRRIEKLNEYERMHGVDLGEYLLRSGKYPELSEVLSDAPPSRSDDAFGDADSKA